MKNQNIYVFLLCSFTIVSTTATNGDASKTSELISDLPDFEFDTGKVDHELNSDYHYGDDGLSMDDIDLTMMDNSGANVFAAKEQLVRQALLRATKEAANRRKFTQIMPILRSLSKPQRLVLAAVMSAQANSAMGRSGVSLSEVEKLFGDRKKLILPLIYDIANLVRTSAYGKNLEPTIVESMPVPQFLRRNFDTNSSASMDYNIPIPDNNLQDSRIDIEDDVATTKNVSALVESADKQKKRDRSIVQQPQIISSMQPRKIDERSYHERKLNMTNFNGTKDQEAIESNVHYQITLPQSLAAYSNLSLEQYEELALGQINGSIIENGLNVSTGESLPTPEMLIRYKIKIPPRKYTRPVAIEGYKNCERFGGLCLKADDYPMAMIMGSIRRHKHAMSALLAEFTDKDDFEYTNYLQEITDNNKRREDDDDHSPGTMCPSVIRYARPQKARSAAGEWKYIVNTGQHTQTLRLEKCSKAEESCTYLTDNFRSRCVQVYNYHRLLSWDHYRGLHVDIFKVPTCCSCHIDGYKEKFPPLSSYSGTLLSSFNNHDFGDDYRFSASQIHPNTHYATIVNNDEEQDDDEGSVAYQYANGFKRYPNKFNKYTETSGLTTVTKPRYEKNKTSKLALPPALEAYLTPPTFHEFDGLTHSFKRGPSSGKRNRRPLRKNIHDLHDQNLASSDILSDITLIPSHDLITERSSLVAKRKSSTTPLSSTLSTKRISTADLPNISTSPASSVDLGKRVNYNYHPIIDFFGESMTSEKEIEDRVGYSHTPPHNWRPVQLDRRRRFQK